MIIVTSDTLRKLVIVQMSGFLAIEDILQFRQDRDEAVAAMGLKTGEYFVLVDTTEYPIQSQQVTKALMDVLAGSPIRAKRLAVVRHDSLTRMQTQRILSVREEAQSFSSIAEAEDWLFSATAS